MKIAKDELQNNIEIKHFNFEEKSNIIKLLKLYIPQERIEEKKKLIEKVCIQCRRQNLKNDLISKNL